MNHVDCGNAALLPHHHSPHWVDFTVGLNRQFWDFAGGLSELTVQYGLQPPPSSMLAGVCHVWDSLFRLVISVTCSNMGVRMEAQGPAGDTPIWPYWKWWMLHSLVVAYCWERARDAEMQAMKGLSMKQSFNFFKVTDTDDFIYLYTKLNLCSLHIQVKKTRLI